MALMWDTFKRYLCLPVNYLKIKRKNVEFLGNKPHINGIIDVHGNGKIIIGENVFINSSRSSNPIGGDTKTILTALLSDSVIRIGNNVGISNSAFICRDEIIIEDNVKIGGGCKVYDNDFHSLEYDKRINGKIDEPKIRKIVIRKGAFIGAHCILLKGVEVGEKSVIGAGSVVTGNVPANEIWGGNPARFIRKISG